MTGKKKRRENYDMESLHNLSVDRVALKNLYRPSSLKKTVNTGSRINVSFMQSSQETEVPQTNVSYIDTTENQTPNQN